MTRTRRMVQAVACAILLNGLMTAQPPQASSQRTVEQQQSYRKAMEDADQKIADEVKSHSELMKNLEYLTTQIGPRLTGSQQMQAASDWTPAVCAARAAFKSAKLSWSIGRSW